MMADEILLGSRTMIRLVDDLLDFSRLDSSRLRLDRSRVDMADLLRRHVQAWRGQAGGERLRLEVEPRAGDVRRPDAARSDHPQPDLERAEPRARRHRDGAGVAEPAVGLPGGRGSGPGHPRG